MVTFLIAKLTHRPHYQGFIVCSSHALPLTKMSRLVALEPVVELPPLGEHEVRAGHSHCRECNREHGVG
jgi:hypothetical protein